MPDETSALWVTTEMTCVLCGHRQVSVYPHECTKLECGGCGHMNDAPSILDFLGEENG